MKVRSRFSYFRDKLQVFFLGFLLGIVLGGGFFLLKFDSYIKDLSFYKSLTNKDEKDPNDLDQPKGNDDASGSKKTEKKKSVNVATNNTPVSGDSLAADTTLPVALDGDQAGGDEIVVRKDEMTGQKSFSIVNLDQPADSANAKTAADNGHYVTVEFWKSPLNYRGYKFSRSRLVLFGFDSGEVQSMYKSENATYLKTALGVFRVEISSDFHQLERVTDESLIARMQ